MSDIIKISLKENSMLGGREFFPYVDFKYMIVLEMTLKMLTVRIVRSKSIVHSKKLEEFSML